MRNMFQDDEEHVHVIRFKEILFQEFQEAWVCSELQCRKMFTLAGMVGQLDETF